MFNVRVFVQTMITLASASLGLVAALAWNEAIKLTILTVLGPRDTLEGMYLYAVTATVLAVAVLSLLGWIAARVGGVSVIKREVEGGL